MVIGAFATARKGENWDTFHAGQETRLMIAGDVTPTGRKTASGWRIVE